MKTTRLRSNDTGAFAACALMLLALCLSQPANVRAQWTTDGSQNITNTNTGNVGIGTVSPSSKLTLGNNSTFTIQTGQVHNTTLSAVGLTMINVASSTTLGTSIVFQGNRAIVPTVATREPRLPASELARKTSPMMTEMVPSRLIQLTTHP